MSFKTALIQLPLVCESSGAPVSTPADVHRVCCDIADLAQETFAVLCIDGRNRLINRHLVAVGLVGSCPVHPREVYRGAIESGASAVVLAHNHPSGDPTPSVEDLRVTRQLIEAGTIIGIRVMDHVIIGRASEPAGDQPGRPGFLSLREKGLCSFSGGGAA